MRFEYSTAAGLTLILRYCNHSYHSLSWCDCLEHRCPFYFSVSLNTFFHQFFFAKVSFIARQFGFIDHFIMIFFSERPFGYGPAWLNMYCTCTYDMYDIKNNSLALFNHFWETFSYICTEKLKYRNDLTLKNLYL